jgi:hypothetical protein
MFGIWIGGMRCLGGSGEVVAGCLSHKELQIVSQDCSARNAVTEDQTCTNHGKTPAEPAVLAMLAAR